MVDIILFVLVELLEILNLDLYFLLFYVKDDVFDVVEDIFINRCIGW